jgi:hypothetical protein
VPAAHDALGDPAAGDCGARSTDFVHSGTNGRNTTAGSIAQAYLCPCPVPGHGKGRGDRNPSLSIADGDDGKLLVRCFAGCDSVDVLAELRRRGLTDKPKASRRRDPFADHHRATGAPVQGDEAASRAVHSWGCREGLRSSRSCALQAGGQPVNIHLEGRSAWNPGIYPQKQCAPE